MALKKNYIPVECLEITAHFKELVDEETFFSNGLDLGLLVIVPQT